MSSSESSPTEQDFQVQVKMDALTAPPMDEIQAIQKDLDAMTKEAKSPIAPKPPVYRPRGDQEVPIVTNIYVVAFHHTLGPVIEYGYPEDMYDHRTEAHHVSAPEEWHNLAFVALPDGAHQHNVDTSYFHITAPAELQLSQRVMFGVAQYRQVHTKDLLKKSSHDVRSRVQKAVVVLARKPVFGFIQQKLAVVTRAFFSQLDFSQRDVIRDLYDNLNATLSKASFDQTFYTGTVLREMVYHFRFRTLQLFKLLLLEKRIMFYSNGLVSKIGPFIYSLLSLIPGLVERLANSRCSAVLTQDGRAPLSEGEKSVEENTPVARAKQRLQATTETNAALEGSRSVGLPLNLLSDDYALQPYLPLNEVDSITPQNGVRTFLVGVSNAIILDQRELAVQVVVDVNDFSISFMDPVVESLVSLTPSDRAFMDAIVRRVRETWSAAEEDPEETKIISEMDETLDRWIRDAFQRYLLALFATFTYSEQVPGDSALVSNQSTSTIEKGKPDPDLADFHLPFVMAWCDTKHFESWRAAVHERLHEFVDAGHPGAGTQVLQDVQIQLNDRFQELGLDKVVMAGRERLNPIRQTIGKTVNHWMSELDHRRQQLQQQPPPDLKAAVNTAATTTAQFLGSVGSFISSKWQQQATQSSPSSNSTSGWMNVQRRAQPTGTVGARPLSSEESESKKEFTFEEAIAFENDLDSDLR